MGKVFSSIFGGSASKQKSTEQSQSSSNSQNASWNDAYPSLQKAFEPAVAQGGQSTDFLSSLLGLHGDPAASDAFNQYKDSSGYGFMMDSGRKAIDSSAAAKGTLNSGSTLKALDQFGQNTGSSFFNNYLDRLLGLSGQGLQAGQVISGAGQKSMGDSVSKASSSGSSSGSSYAKPGIAAFLGKAASAAAGG